MREWQWSTSVSFPFVWEMVAKALVNRYPNPFATHVISEDVLHTAIVTVEDSFNTGNEDLRPQFDAFKTSDRHISHRGTKALYVKKLLTKTNRMPLWGERVLSARQVLIIEESLYVPRQQTIMVYTRNVNLNRFMSLIEKCVYNNDSDNVDNVSVNKHVWLASNCLRGLRSAVCKFGLERYKKNCEKANQGLLWVLQQLEYNKYEQPSSSHLEDLQCTTADTENCNNETKKADTMTTMTTTLIHTVNRDGSAESRIPNLSWLQRFQRLFGATINKE